MKFGLELRTALGQTLTPQQIQYLKLLQMPVLQLESQVRQEIELNPMLEDAEDFDISDFSSNEDNYSDKYDEYSESYPNDYDNLAEKSNKIETYSDSYGEFDAKTESYDYNSGSDYDSYSDNSRELKFQENAVDDKLEPFEFHKMLWDGGDEYGQNYNSSGDEDDNEPFQIKDNTSLTGDLMQQLRLFNFNEEELILGEQIIGNIDEDGYLRRDLFDIVEETNNLIKELNFDAYYKVYEKRNKTIDEFDIEQLNKKEEAPLPSSNNSQNNSQSYSNNKALNNMGVGNKYYQEFAHLFQQNQPKVENKIENKVIAKSIDFGEMDVNPALKYALSPESAKALSDVYTHNNELNDKINQPNLEKIFSYGESLKNVDVINEVSLEMAEMVLAKIQTLEPAGIGSRTIQECLLAQLKAIHNPNPAQILAKEIITDYYDAFAKKHFATIVKVYSINEDMLRDTMDEIKRLNPRPGGGDYQSEMNTVIPDFSIEIEDKTNDIIITVNDSRLPALKLSKAYQNMKKEAKFKLYNKDTRDWIRNKYEDAKFLIQALRQRKNTMLKVMTSIAGLQKEFFTIGPSALKPLIYKDVAEDTGLDISTVCRIVNGKYVQTDFGTFELKYYFSESLPTDEGEEVSTRVIKQILKEIIDTENKTKPFSDDKLSKYLKKSGYNVARRTVAKYREQLKIPVARLRKEI